ncbi:hypothetical protein SteCoe_29985 [Stentor coeruleus]|uniref:Serine aminopeptidase S33 domain-containing protein n=1 Tax=Stentor coeruleus TaxID=5963 RepID=A0A1R2B4M5_9CILI|nr:hypothetical protein SteCoe_29985 [Stentor coeruleus]
MQMLANLIIRPYRDIYTTRDLHPFYFTMSRRKFFRKDIELLGQRGKLVCSWYDEVNHPAETCVIYCHGNSGSRLDSEEVLDLVLKLGMSLFCFDFSGCGLSEGDFVSLGYFEKDDISTAVKYIYSENHEVNIVLWGRSMGAAACIFYSYSNPHIIAMILDSPFADFSKVADEMVAEYKVPKFLRSYLLDRTTEYIKTHVSFDIKQLIPRNFIKNCKIPTIFIHSCEDKLIKIDHSRELYEVLKGPKCFMEITGEHNSVRDKIIVGKALKIVQFLITKSRDDEQEMVTARERPPEFQPDLAKLIRHRRGVSQGNNNRNC